MGSGIVAEAFSFLLLSLISAVAVAQGGSGAAGELWCVAMNNAEDDALQAALDWTCGPGGADCGPIQKGGPCYDGSDLPRTASYAFNSYYLKNGPSDESCNFGNTAALTSLNPSHGNCKFPSSLSSDNGNFSGQIMGGSGNADLSSSNAVPHRWIWGSPSGYLIFGMILIFLCGEGSQW